jgi:hypothetical protein
MLAVDTNVLVYAHRREPPEHATAFDMLRSLAVGSAPWAIEAGLLSPIPPTWRGPPQRSLEPAHGAAEKRLRSRSGIAQPP